MTLIRSFLVLATVVSGVLAPLFFGHALANHEMKWVLFGGIMLLLSLALGFVSTRGGPARHAGA